MVVPVIKTPDADTYFVIDLDPELAKQEKQEFLEELDDSSRLIFFHDPLKESLFYP